MVMRGTAICKQVFKKVISRQRHTVMIKPRLRAYPEAISSKLWPRVGASFKAITIACDLAFAYSFDGGV